MKKATLRVPPLPDALDGLAVLFDAGQRPPRSDDAGLELARAVAEYFGNSYIHPALTSDIALRNCALAIIAERAS